MKWVCLFSSIACEVIDTTLLKLLSDGESTPICMMPDQSTRIFASCWH